MRFHFLLVFVTIIVSCIQEPGHLVSGGYNYPDKQYPIDTNDYSHPIRDLLSTRDSFNYAYYEKFFHRSLNEPNLSIKPLGQPIYRLTYRSAFGDVAIVAIFNNRIVAKQLVEGDPYPVYDSTKISPLERHFYEILYWNFPLENRIQAGRKYLDSLSKVYPQLLDPNYYKALLDKCLVPNKYPAVYTTKEFSISQSKYRSLLKCINSIGYWSMPFEIACRDISTDGYGVTLEANTPTKYNIVYRINCTKEEIPFLKLCQEIVNLANFKDHVYITSSN